MPRDSSSPADKAREWRRKVLVTARMRSPDGWEDVRILNVSARGMMILTAQPMRQGSMIELRRGDQVMLGKVMWRTGTRAGLRSESVLPVTDLLCASEKLGAPRPSWSPASSSRRRRSAGFDEAANRYRARVMQFAAVAGVAGMVAFGLGSTAMATLGPPLRQMRLAMGG